MEITYRKNISEENYFIRAVGIVTRASTMMPQPASSQEAQSWYLSTWQGL